MLAANTFKPSLSSIIGNWTTALTSCLPKSPTVKLRSAPISFNETGVRITFKIPPVVFLPNKVPCGPRSTSILSISKLSRRTPLDVPRNIPSITTPIAGS